MILVVLAALGLVLGSFVNALIWRVRAQETAAKPNKDLSILHGRSMCPSCRHTLQALDLIPVISWVALRGKCRYCHKPISRLYPLVELLTAALFIVSYLFWPEVIIGQQQLLFAFWLIFVTGFVALLVYDARWMMLPNRIIYPLMVLAAGQWLAVWWIYGLSGQQLLDIGLSVLVAGGIFYVLFQVSGGKWIGGGDVKLGFLLGLLIAKPVHSFLLLFMAALLGSLVSIPLMIVGKAGRKTRIPFGPFLLAGGFVVMLFGAAIIGWYQRVFLLY